MIRNPRKQRLVSEINITPFTDVILVLLVIFMITTPLITESSIKVRLPQAKNADSQQSPPASQVSITINNESLVYLDSKLVTRKELIEKIRALHRENSDLSVVLRSDRLVRFKDIVDILDPLVGMGINKLNIAAATEE